MVNVYKQFHSFFCEYSTSKLVRINNKKVGCVNRLIQLLIIGYVIGYVIVYEKGYQKFDEGLATVTTKVKGIGYTNLSIRYPVRIKNRTTSRAYNQGPRAWDSTDYVKGYDDVFVMTNMIITPVQTQGKCPEYGLRAGECKNDSQCIAGKVLRKGHGIMTGKCIESDRTVSKMCEIQAWCPVEDSKLPMNGTNFGEKLTRKSILFEEAENFTIFIKNTVRFPEFGVSVQNIDNNHIDPDYLAQCEYDHKDQRLCPIIRLSTIFDGISGTTFKDMALMGGMVGIKIAWECNLDVAISKCLPRYKFLRLDNANAKISPGYNIRFAEYHTTDEKLKRRTLIKAYGIRFVIMVDAMAGKFDIVPLLRNFGAGLGLLALATVLCDICVLYCLKQRGFYRSRKYLYADHKQQENQPMQDETADTGYNMF